MSRIREAIEGAIEYLTANPADAVSTDSLATARLGDGLRVVVIDPEGRSIASDMVPSVGGSGSAPSPGWYLRAATASCVTTLIAMRAAQVGVEIRSLEVDVDSVSNDLGILGIDPDVPAGPLSARVAVRLALAEGGEPRQARDLVDWAVDHCPVTDTIRRAVPLTVDA
jgi:uncharacterized OsmC-like protein